MFFPRRFDLHSRITSCVSDMLVCRSCCKMQQMASLRTMLLKMRCPCVCAHASLVANQALAMLGVYADLDPKQLEPGCQKIF